MIHIELKLCEVYKLFCILEDVFYTHTIKGTLQFYRIFIINYIPV